MTPKLPRIAFLIVIAAGVGGPSMSAAGEPRPPAQGVTVPKGQTLPAPTDAAAPQEGPCLSADKVISEGAFTAPGADEIVTVGDPEYKPDFYDPEHSCTLFTVMRRAKGRCAQVARLREQEWLPQQYAYNVTVLMKLRTQSGRDILLACGTEDRGGCCDGESADEYASCRALDFAVGKSSPVIGRYQSDEVSGCRDTMEDPEMEPSVKDKKPLIVTESTARTFVIRMVKTEGPADGQWQSEHHCRDIRTRKTVARRYALSFDGQKLAAKEIPNPARPDAGIPAHGKPPGKAAKKTGH